MPISKNTKKGLGRGFESLIPTDLLDESFDPTASQDQQISELRQIKLDQIIVDPNQPRRHFDEAEIEELALSISEHGVLQPIIVTPHGNGYQIVAGERRFRASKIAKIDKIPALVRTLSDQRRLEISLIENLQRTDLNVIETAMAYLKLRDQFNMTLEQIGKRVGNKSISAISNTLRLLRLPNFVREELVKGTVTEGQVRPLIGMDESVIKSTLSRMIKEQWAARKVEQFIVDYKKNQSNKDISRAKRTVVQPYAAQLKRMQHYLSADVKIQTNSKGAGRITIKFKNEEEFERLQKLLG